MCSGCSGAFDGDGEEQELNYRLPFEDESGCGESVSGQREGAERAAPEILSGCSMGTTEEYEVLVSAERIVERRTICAKHHVFSKKGIAGGGEGRQESVVECKQARPETAKYYRTESELHVGRRQENVKGGMWLICWYLGGLAAFGAVLWLALG